MKLQIEMPWERDLTVNHMRFGPGGRYRKKPHVQAWMRALSWQLRALTRNYVFEVPVQLTVDFRFPDARTRDTHNYAKVICDAVSGGIFVNDKDIRFVAGTVMVDKKQAGFTITVEDEG